MKKVLISIVFLISINVFADINSEIKNLKQLKVDNEFIEGYKKAVNEFSSTKKLSDKYMAEYLNIGMIYLKNSKYDEAIELYNRILKSNLKNVSTNYWAYYGISSAYFYKKNFKNSFEYGKKAIEMDIKLKKELTFIPKDEMEDYRRRNLAERTFLSGYSQEKYEEILNIFLETIKDENYKNVISKDEIIIKALVSATMQIRKKDEKLSDKYLKELEKLKIFKVVKVD